MKSRKSKNDVFAESSVAQATESAIKVGARVRTQ